MGISRLSGLARLPAPWLEAKLKSLEKLTSHHREMVAKEMRFSSGRLHSRVSASAEGR